MTDIAIVNEQDEIIGSASKEVALRDELIHRIARIVVVNGANEILLQQRGQFVDSPGKWDHSVSGHVDAGEDYVQAALREAQEEMGFENLTLEPLVKLYREKTHKGKLLRRFHLLFIARTEETPRPAPDEVAGIQWISPQNLTEWISAEPNDFSATVVKMQPALTDYFTDIS